MPDYSSHEKWPAKVCASKWRESNPHQGYLSEGVNRQPAQDSTYGSCVASTVDMQESWDRVNNWDLLDFELSDDEYEDKEAARIVRSASAPPEGRRKNPLDKYPGMVKERSGILRPKQNHPTMSGKVDATGQEHSLSGISMPPPPLPRPPMFDFHADEGSGGYLPPFLPDF